MEPLLVGLLTGLTSLTGMVLYLLLVHPDSVLSMVEDRPLAEDAFFEVHPGALVVLRAVTSALLVLLAVATGAAAAFLSGS